MAELPSVIPSALIRVINTLESDDTHQYHWKISRNSENVSLFVKCILPAKSVTHDKVVPGLFPVKPAGKKSRKKKTPSALRRSANRLKRFRKRGPLNKLPYLKALPRKLSVPSERNRKPPLSLPRTVVTIWNHHISLLV